MRTLDDITVEIAQNRRAAELAVAGAVLSDPSSRGTAWYMDITSAHFESRDTLLIFNAAVVAGKENRGRMIAMKVARMCLKSESLWRENEINPGEMWSDFLLADMVVGVKDARAQLKMWCPQLIELCERINEAARLWKLYRDVLLNRVDVRTLRSKRIG